MKVSVVGYIIETKNIYIITPIDKCAFDIYFLNNTRHRVWLSYSMQSVISEDIRMQKTITLRNKLIDLWNQDKLEIIQLEF